jgi:hypothetical protein
MALATIADVLPSAELLETRGEMNEDWLFTLRIQRVLDSKGGFYTTPASVTTIAASRRRSRRSTASTSTRFATSREMTT